LEYSKKEDGVREESKGWMIHICSEHGGDEQ
jgi:hypothetical protein